MYGGETRTCQNTKSNFNSSAMLVLICLRLPTWHGRWTLSSMQGSSRHVKVPVVGSFRKTAPWGLELGAAWGIRATISRDKHQRRLHGTAAPLHRPPSTSKRRKSCRSRRSSTPPPQHARHGLCTGVSLLGAGAMVSLVVASNHIAADAEARRQEVPRSHPDPRRPLYQ